MRDSRIKDFKIDWTKFDSAGDQHVIESSIAKKAGKLAELVDVFSFFHSPSSYLCFYGFNFEPYT